MQIAFAKSLRWLLPLALLAIILGLMLTDLGQPTGPFQGRHVLIIGMDGMRPDALLRADAPNIQRLMARGVVTHDAIAGGWKGTAREQPTVSGPGWASILAGVWMNKHGIKDNEFAGQQLAKYPPFFQRLKESEPTAHVSSIVSWNPLDTQILAKASSFINFRSQGQGDTYAARDQSVCQQALAHLASAGPDVLFLHFDQIDGAGHASGFSAANPAYLSAIHAVDAHIGAVLRALEQRPKAKQEKWLVILTTDHGGINNSHGGQTEDERRITLLVSGPGLSPRQLTNGPGHTAVPATTLAYLGVSIQPGWGWEDGAFGLPPYPPAELKVANAVADKVVLTWKPAVGLSASNLLLKRNNEAIAELPLETMEFADKLPAEAGALSYVYTLEVVGGTSTTVLRAEFTPPRDPR